MKEFSEHGRFEYRALNHAAVSAHVLYSPFELKRFTLIVNLVAQATSAVLEQMLGMQTNCCGDAAVG